jgi:quinol monooxygenase YgiN
MSMLPRLPLLQWYRNPGGGLMALEVFAHLTIRPGQLEGFRTQAAECIRITKEKDTRTLRYDWFVSSDGTECEVHEAYTGPEGLIEHNSHILEARNKLFKDYAANHFMTVYGEASQPLLDLFKAHGVGFKWFYFVQGLEDAPAIRSRISGTPKEETCAAD